MFSLAFISFIAGILTILAPCVLPVLPVILAGSVGERQKWYPYIVTGSLALSIVIFTILLKVSTLFIGVPSEFWRYLSGVILLVLGLVYVFPHVWTQISSKVFGSRANIALDTAQDIGNPFLRAIITGAVLGPVFSTCSPTYTLLLATVFPVSLISGIFYTLIYALGLSFVLLFISIFGTSLMRKLKIFADERGVFRKVLGIVLAIVGLMIITGIDKRLEATILQKYDIPSIENSVINQLFPNFNHMNTPITPTTDVSNLKKAYFAGGCFWCMEGIFEAQEGVKEAIS